MGRLAVSWKEKLYDDPTMVDIDAMADRARRASTHTVGLVHPIHGASVVIDDRGVIDLFSFAPVGIRIDPRTGSVNVYAAPVNVSADGVVVDAVSVGIDAVRTVSVLSSGVDICTEETDDGDGRISLYARGPDGTARISVDPAGGFVEICTDSRHIGSGGIRFVSEWPGVGTASIKTASFERVTETGEIERGTQVNIQATEVNINGTQF